MKNEKIAVIVPVYKTEQYIAECIESILTQTYTNFRLILVDDGTPDNAGKICDEYVAKDNRITVIHQENAGVTRARARGVEEANDCEWITFVDSDDMIKDIFLQELYQFTSYSTDIVLCTSYYTETSQQKKITDYPFEKKLDITEFRKLMAKPGGGMPWGRLFKREVITPNVFDIPREIYYAEDAIMNLRIGFNTEKDVLTTSKALYFYRQQTQGVCNNFKFNLEYEELLRKHFYLSIPQNVFETYKDVYLYRRILMWTTFFNNTFLIKEPHTAFRNTLIREIEEYNYKLSFFDEQLLKHTNPVLRFIIITIRKSVNLFRRFIK